MKSQLDEGIIRHGHGEWHNVNAFLLLLLRLLLLLSVHNEVVVDLCTWFKPWTPRRVDSKLNIKDSYPHVNSICDTKDSYAQIYYLLKVGPDAGCSNKAFPDSSSGPAGNFTELYLSLISFFGFWGFWTVWEVQEPQNQKPTFISPVKV